MISIVKICLIYEDSFGKEFFKNITKDLKDKNLINKKNSLDFKGKLTLNTKLKRIISTIVNDDKKQCDKIVIEYDCDGKCNEITSNINRILGEYKAYVSLLPIKFEIEEWICDSLRIKYNSKETSS